MYVLYLYYGIIYFLTLTWCEIDTSYFLVNHNTTWLWKPQFIDRVQQG